MPEVNHHFVLELSGGDGTATGRAPITIDWLPAVEHAHFAAIRAGKLPAVTAAPPSTIEPIWDPVSGMPYVSGARVVLGADGAASSADIPLEYFGASARDASAEFVKDGTLKAGETFRYRVTAFAAGPQCDRGAAPILEVVVEEVEQPLDITDTPVRTFLEKSVPVGTDEPDDFPVFLPHRLLEEARALVREAGDVETGGVLLGRLHRDPARPEVVFVELSAQVPALHAERGVAKLTFTPETWAAASAALELRDAGESIQGWWHSHPNWCRSCASERKKVCPLNEIFFSKDDCGLHRTVFPRAYHLGLLLSDRDLGIVPALFGWRRGLVVCRSFHLLDVRGPVAEPAPAVIANIGGTERANQDQD